MVESLERRGFDSFNVLLGSFIELYEKPDVQSAQRPVGPEGFVA